MYQIIQGSIFYRCFQKLDLYYQSSLMKNIASAFAQSYRNSVLGKCLKSLAQRESSMEHSLFIRMISYLFKIADRLVTGISKAISKWSWYSVIASFFRAVFKASGQKLFVLVLPLFGVGYMAGRIYRDRLMIRDVLFLGLLFIAGAIWMTEPERKRNILRNSLLYRFCSWILG